jgi:hypothetical protein
VESGGVPAGSGRVETDLGVGLGDHIDDFLRGVHYREEIEFTAALSDDADREQQTLPVESPIPIDGGTVLICQESPVPGKRSGELPGVGTVPRATPLIDHVKQDLHPSQWPLPESYVSGNGQPLACPPEHNEEGQL